MFNHDLKILPEFFAEVLSGRLRVQIRFDDRAYMAGDNVTLREYVPGDANGDGAYTGNVVKAKIGHVYREFPGMHADFVMFTLV
jgi:hypothetical protein